MWTKMPIGILLRYIVEVYVINLKKKIITQNFTLNLEKTNSYVYIIIWLFNIYTYSQHKIYTSCRVWINVSGKCSWMTVHEEMKSKSFISLSGQH